MAFMNSEGVQQVQKRREIEKNKPSDKEFANQLETMFGRKTNLEKTKRQIEASSTPLDEIKVLN